MNMNKEYKTLKVQRKNVFTNNIKIVNTLFVNFLFIYHYGQLRLLT